MAGVHEFYLFDESTEVATAIGRLLLGKSTIETIAPDVDVEEERLRRTISSMGLEESIRSASTPTEDELPPPRPWPDFLKDRDDVSRRREGIRDDSVPEEERSYEISFFRWLISEAMGVARDKVQQHLQEELGEDANALSVSQRGVPSKRGFPPDVQWIVVEYPKEADDAKRHVVPDPPTFPFERLQAALPIVVDADVEREGETFRIKKIPAVAQEVVLR